VGQRKEAINQSVNQPGLSHSNQLDQNHQQTSSLVAAVATLLSILLLLLQ
jgi:hypothetical protein